MKYRAQDFRTPRQRRHTTAEFFRSRDLKDHNGMGSFDYLISDKHTLVGVYQYEQDPLQAPFPF